MNVDALNAFNNGVKLAKNNNKQSAAARMQSELMNSYNRSRSDQQQFRGIAYIDENPSSRTYGQIIQPYGR